VLGMTIATRNGLASATEINPVVTNASAINTAIKPFNLIVPLLLFAEGIFQNIPRQYFLTINTNSCSYLLPDHHLPVGIFAAATELLFLTIFLNFSLSNYFLPKKEP
jgi:hypothetical protein